MTAKQILDKNFDNMVEVLKKTISFDSTKSQALPNAPFGKNVYDCMQYVEQVCKDIGLDTYNCDGYAFHADMKGSGDEVLGILGHLDIVPAKQSDGWITSPFGGEIIDNKLYGRGTMDDKGPMIACLFAVKALKESGFKPTKTIRLIFGGDEESGMQCVHHYFSKVKAPDIAFSPDGDFPVINREKGIYQFWLNCGKLSSQIVSITAGERTNVVAGKCQAVISDSVEPQVVDGVQVEHINSQYVLTALGKNAHGSTPQEGINATWAIFHSLAKTFPNDSVLQYVSSKLCDYTGKSWGIALNDEQSGNLTCNIGVVRYNSSELKLGIDIRFPISYTCQDMYNTIKAVTPYEVTPDHIAEPLFVPQESHLVTTLLEVYGDYTNTKPQPLAIGGGTYSRCIKNCVAFGPLFPDDEQTIHMPNECVDLDKLRTMTHIFMEAIYKLAK